MAERDALETCLGEYKPHVLWFSGHGRNRNGVELMLADGRWMSAADFAKLLKRSMPFPQYAVFWACDTGTARRSGDEVASGPPLFEELKKIGVISVLAMQTSISDEGALAMVAELYRGLGNGRPLERAVAGARARLIGGRTERMRPLDWATPVVWSASLPVPRLEWKAGSREWTQLQVLGRATLGASASSPADLVLPVRERERSRARAWGGMRGLWVQNDPTGADFRAEWIRYLQAVQSEYKTFVVAVDMTKGDVASSLSSWAEEVYSRLLPADLPSEIVGILSHLRIRPMDAWPKLCKLEGMYLAIASPPGSDEEWFWKRCVERSLFGFGERSARLSGGRKRHGPPVGLVRSRGQAAR